MYENSKVFKKLNRQTPTKFAQIVGHQLSAGIIPEIIIESGGSKCAELTLRATPRPTQSLGNGNEC
jgi:hypothetical protein